MLDRSFVLRLLIISHNVVGRLPRIMIARDSKVETQKGPHPERHHGENHYYQKQLPERRTMMRTTLVGVHLRTIRTGHIVRFAMLTHRARVFFDRFLLV